MKNIALIIAIYAVIILIGGLFGYITANSIPSLIASSIFAGLLFISLWRILKGDHWAIYLALGCATLLFIFFASRFYLTWKFMPAGFMAITSFIVSSYLTFCTFQKNNETKF